QSLTQYQATNDGKVTKAQSDATQALGLVATKVSQTDYNTKTGDLDSKYTAVKQTADQASTDIVAIKSTNTSQDTKINTLTSDVSGTKQSISDIQTEQGAQSTKINTIQTDVSGTKQDISDIQDANGVQDGKIASISTTVDGLSSSFSTYKTTNDGKVAKAQADITANATAISQKVSQTAYDTKTGQLQTDLNTTTTTANQAKTDIVAIKKTNTDQDARMTTIESDANGIKTTVSSLQTTANTQAGSISTLKQRADGFDATVTKVNNLSVGGRNLLLHTNTNSYSSLTSGDGQYTTKYVPFDGGYKYQFTYTTASTNYAVYMFWGLQKDKFNPDTDYVLSFMANFTSDVTPSVAFATPGAQHSFAKQITRPKITGGSDQRVVIQLHTTPTIPTESDQGLYMGNFQYAGVGTFTIWDLKIEKGNLASSYTPAPEDVDSATAKAQLTADQATTSLNNYKSDADGRISKAQADIIVNANAITQKVSQSDYNAKTGDLTTKVNTAQSTADSATSTIGAYKTSNDARVASAESQITANATAITQKVSQMDYNTKTGQIDGQISTINQTASDISQSVSDVARQVNTLSQVNLINNSDFRPDLSGWSIQNPSSGTVTTGDYDYAGNVMVLNNTAGGMLRVNSVPITLTGTTTVSYTFNYFIFGLPAGGTVYSQLTYLDSSMKEIYSSYPSSINLATVSTGSWQKRTVSNLGITPPTGATYIVFSFDVRGAGTKAGINRPILVKGGTVGNYVPGQYVNNDKISTVSQTVDSISSIVSDPTTGLTKRVQTAEGSISTVQSNVSDLQSKQTQTANGLTTEISNRATGDTNTLTQAKDFTTSSISNSESGMRSQITQTSDAIIAQVNSINMVANSEFDPIGKGWYQVLPTTGSIVGSELAPGSLTTSFGDWPEAGGSQLVRYDSGSWYASEPRQASSGKQYSASIVAGRTNLTTSVALDLRILWLDSSKKVIGYSSAGNIINTASYTGLKLYKLENQTSPANTAFVAIAIAHSGATSGGYDVVGRPMLNIGSKVGTYSPTYAGTASTTQLALLKDNWSIGIADNAGALASGIAGDLNGMTLISKKITLDGNTTVTGDFYAKGGNFKNINASNITVGNLDADEVRIINLDVNTLTGNVSRFLETNWDGAYGSTKITSTGMKINTQYIQADFQGFGMDFSYSNKKIGGMGISQYLNGEPGLSMRLESEGAYMAWSARNEGNSTGPYIDKLAWYRQGKPALSGNYGFIFSDRVTFNKPINIEGTSINLGFRPINLYGNLFPFFGNQDNMTGFAYTSNEIYMVLQNQYVNLSKVIKALSGLGAWSVPTNIDSTGKVTQWRNVTT
ncbi:gp58-like family protein, partial [Leuconostoc lactis]|uniref:gp58-like family protein n=2 Tax=Leuconostoc lactis TaxID=1246 RepID=UPI00241C2EA6